MSVTRKPEYYVSHGKEFAAKAAAEHHSKLVMAREELEDAQKRFQRLLGESAITADERPFEFGLFHDYYQVFSPYDSLPYLRKFQYFCNAWAVREQIDKPDVVEIQDQYGKGADQKNIWAPITELYHSFDAANVELRNRQRSWLAEKMSALAEGTS